MDLDKLKSFAKTAVEKTKEGIDKANDIRKKSSAETKMTFPASNGFAQPTSVRKTVDGQFYFGLYTDTPVLYEVAGFEFFGSTITQHTKTKGKTKQQGRTGSVLGGALAGSALGPGGALIGAIAGGSRSKKGTIVSTSVTTSQEKPGKVVIKLRNIETSEIKNISTKLTSAEADNARLFFGI